MKNLFSYFGKQIRGDFIYLSKTKIDEARQIPLNNDLEELLKVLGKEISLSPSTFSAISTVKLLAISKFPST